MSTPVFIQYDLGPRLYEYWQKNFNRKCPIPNPNVFPKFKETHPLRFECSVKACKKMFYSLESHRRHMAFHGALMCEHCGKGFKDATMLKKHVMNVHFQVVVNNAHTFMLAVFIIRNQFCQSKLKVSPEFLN